MRKITKDAARAFFGGYKFKRDNTEVRWCDVSESWKMYLHGNLIAYREPALHGLSQFWICDGGWSSNTTKERLNGLLPIGQGIHQKNWQWYLNSHEWNGNWVFVRITHES